MDIRITMTLENASIDELASALVLARNVDGAPTEALPEVPTEPEPESAAEPEKPRRGRKKAEPPAAEAEDEDVQDADEEDDAVTLDDLRKYTVAYKRAHGADDVKTLFRKYGVTKVSGLTPEQIAPFYADLKAMEDED